MRSVESVFVAQYFNIFLSKVALIKLNNQFIQIIIRDVRVSETANCYSNTRINSPLFVFFVFFLVQYVFGIRVSVQEDKASPGDQDRKFYILYLNLFNFSNLTTKYNV